MVGVQPQAFHLQLDSEQCKHLVLISRQVMWPTGLFEECQILIFLIFFLKIYYGGDLSISHEVCLLTWLHRLSINPLLDLLRSGHASLPDLSLPSYIFQLLLGDHEGLPGHLLYMIPPETSGDWRHPNELPQVASAASAASFGTKDTCQRKITSGLEVDDVALQLYRDISGNFCSNDNKIVTFSSYIQRIQ